VPTTLRDKAEPPLVLALDLGSSSFRATVYDRLGRELDGTEGRLPVRWRRTADGGVEADADAMVEAACRAVDAALAGAGQRAAEIRAVGISTLWHSLLGVGPGGRPVTPVYSWADQRSAADARWLREHLDEERVRRRTGCVFHPSYPAARLLWLRRTDPGAFRGARWWGSLGDYLTFRCFGQVACSISMASGSGLLDQHTCQWDAEVVDAIGLDPAALPPLVDLDAPFMGLSRPYASRWPVLSQVPWVPAAGDGALSNLGTGCTSPSRAAVVLGTSAALRILHPGPVPDVPYGLWNYRASRTRVLTGGALSNGGSVYRWVVEQVGVAERDGVDRALRARAADGHGLVVLPFLAGERSPTWPLEARGAIVGLTLSTGALDLVQALVEAVALRLAWVWELLRSVFPGPVELVASGGAIRHLPFWAQVIADALGEPVRVSDEAEGSSRGAALVALEALGAAWGEEQAVPPGTVLAPDPARHARYREARARQRRVEAALEPLARGSPGSRVP
jgi:gluconokinase